MNVTITLEHRFVRTPDGAVWTQTAFAYSFWKRYLDVFDDVRIAARAADCNEQPTKWHRVDGDGVTFFAIPYYVGLPQYLRQRHAIIHMAQDLIATGQAFILRPPSLVASHFWPYLMQTQHPYGVEAVGDAYACYAPGAVHHPLRPLFRQIFTRQMQQQCQHACAVSYVSAASLQPRFPASPGTFTIGCSDIELDERWISMQPRPLQRCPTPATLVSIGSLGQMYKAPDILIAALARCRQRGLNLHLRLIGDGKHRHSLERLAAKLGVSDSVHFLGQLPSGDVIIQQLDVANLFVMPSRTEGLPRAMIEAMARGLPCIGSHVGGIPELLEEEDCVPPGNIEALARKIREVLDDPIRMARMSERNLLRCMEYTERKLAPKRLAFLRHLRSETARLLGEDISRRLAA